MSRRDFLKLLGVTIAGAFLSGCRGEELPTATPSIIPTTTPAMTPTATATVPAATPSTYSIHSTRNQPELQGQWDGPVWQTAETLDVAFFRPEGSDHHPQTRTRLLYDGEALYGIFQVRDRYVRCVHTDFQSQTYQDSCVEFFVQPKPDQGYFNFEFNCGGALACAYNTSENGLITHTRLLPEEGEQIRIFHSLPEVTYPEIQKETLWYIEFAIPFSVLERHVGPIGVLANQVWRANFYKCGDLTSHPHWASWMPIDELNFHLPRCFGRILFES